MLTKLLKVKNSLLQIEISPSQSSVQHHSQIAAYAQNSA